MTETTNVQTTGERIVCKACEVIGDPKTYAALAIAVIATWDDIPAEVRDSQWAKWLHSLLLYAFAGATIGLRRPASTIKP